MFIWRTAALLGAVTMFISASLHAETAFYYAYELKGAPITVKGGGDYAVWLWVKGEQSAELKLGDETFKVTDGPDKKLDTAGVWLEAGKVTLKAGKDVNADASEAVLALVLSNKKDFKPEGVEKKLRVQEDLGAFSDPRAQLERHTDTDFTMTEYADLDAWKKDADVMRRRIQASSGLFPLPPKTPLNAKIWGKKEFEDYSVEKVCFEAYPGFLVTGNLYRPIGKQGPFPGVVCPHGHWEHGRLENSEMGSVPARNITFARMGMVAFTYDMVAYNDSLQFKNHRFVNFEDKLWGIHPFGLQLWSSIRAVDFLESLQDVDRERLACTGASGGGTQTFMLSALDPRIKVSAPVNMISHTMQGGCVCENAPYIRLDHSNMEIGALAAPRPMLMVAATGDWTKDTPKVEYPAIKNIYKLYDAEDNLESVQIDAGHNYNKDSRTAVYRFFGKHLLPDQDWSKFEEPTYSLPPVKQLRVFPDGKLPDGYSLDEEEVKAKIKELRREQIKGIMEADAKTMRGLFGPFLCTALGIKLPGEAAAKMEAIDKEGALRRYTLKAEERSIPLLAGEGSGKGTALLLVHPRGKHGVVNVETGAVDKAYLPKGTFGQVVALDTFLTGEYNAPDVATERKVVGTFAETFLPSNVAYRVQDIVDTVAALKAEGYEKVQVSGFGNASLWVLLAAAIDDTIGGYTIEKDTLPKDDKAWAEDRRTQDIYVPSIQSIGGIAMLEKMATKKS